MAFRYCIFTWDEKAEVMRLSPRFRRVAREQYRDGEEYPLEVHEQRSSAQHNRYFAEVNSAWKNLRGQTAEILATPDILRGWALVEAGWFDQHIVEAPSRDSALRMAVFARKISASDHYTEIKVINHDGQWFVRMRMPQSQSRASMDKECFSKSSNDVLNILSGSIEVTRRELTDAARKDAQ